MGSKIKAILQPVKFRKKDHIAILSPNSSEVDAIVREFDEAEWSTGYRFWHIPYSPETLKSLKDKLKHVATADVSAFKGFETTKVANEKKKRTRVKTEKPSPEQKVNIERFCEDFSLKGYSDGTLKVYKCMLNVFYGWYREKDEKEITMDDVHSFIKEYIDKNNFTASYRRLLKNSLQNYFVYKGFKELDEIKYL